MTKLYKTVNIGNIIRIAKTEYVKFVTNPRIIIVGMLLVVIQNLLITPLIERSQKFGEPYNIFEPFIAVCSSTVLLMFVPGVFIVLAADFPDISSHTLFVIKRSGKINWYFGQLISIIMSILSYIAVIMVGCCFFIRDNCQISEDWSNTARKYISRFPNEMENYISQFLSSSLYNQMDLKTTLIHTTLFLVLFMLLTALILMTFRILYLRSAGIFTAFFVVALGLVTCSAGTDSMWYFPSAHALTWKHFKDILREPVMPLSESYKYFGVLIVFFIAVDLVILNKMNIHTASD